jgi:subtilase family serine protease
VEGTVNPKTHTITTKIDHFSGYAILASTRPAAFTVSSLSVSPGEVDIGEVVTISVLVANTGDASGIHEVVLKVNNVVVKTKDMTLAGGASQTVTFTIAKDVAGTYTANVNGLSDTFTVKIPPAPPAPAAFALSDLAISPAEVDIGEGVTISLLVTNTGDLTGSYKVVPKIDNVVVNTKDVTLAGGASRTVAFTIAQDTEGSYTVSIDGKVGQFTVIVPPLPIPTPTPTEALPVQPATNWWLIGGIIAGCIFVVGLLVCFFVWRKRGALRPS